MAFEESSGRKKGRKSKDFSKTVRLPELTHATKMCQISAGKTNAAKHFSEALETAPKGVLRIRKVWVAHNKNIFLPYASEEALSLFTEAHLTKCQYINIRIQAKMKNCNT
jgi:hypothetical protein